MEDRVSPFFTINIKNNWFVRLDDRRAKIENFSDGKTFGDKMLVEKLTLDFGYKQLSIMSKTNVKNSMLWITVCLASMFIKLETKAVILLMKWTAVRDVRS